ncbi:YadA-like family protein [Conchiformibius kuhniae]|uniref:YadA-like family protein n=1 Tax=Conchiformibius kuhniae TaxID=211502 RepID=A0ABD8B729_9NEIS|nr:YadA-like family protein [Conchiformibius kuhniae]
MNDEAPVTVKPTGNAPATVKFVDGQGTTVSLDKTAPQPTVKIDTPLAHVYNEDGSKADAVSLVVNKDDKGNLQPVTIHNVAPGKRGTDAVNVDQLKAGLTQIHNRLGDIADEADAGTAAAMATAGLPQAYLPGKSMVSVAGSTYRGKQGYAVGFSAISDGGNWVIKGSVNGHTRGHFGATVGAGYQW